MKLSFQNILIIVFIIGFVIAIAIFSGLFGSGSKKASTLPTGQVEVWGILPNDAMQTYVQNFNSQNYGYTIAYQYHDPGTIYQDTVNALADGTPPDLVLISSETYAQFGNKLYTIPYAAYSETAFRSTNIDGAQMFLSSNGVGALPLLVDPLVVYYNKDILAAKNFVTPPVTWNDLEAAVPLLTKRAKDNSISQSAIDMGEASNILHARDILSALFLQTGNSIVGTGTQGTTVTLNQNAPGANATTELPAVQALNFYTSFANPGASNYTWNGSLPESLQSFLAGNLAFYIGRASELFTIQSENPNLNFDVTQFFQSNTATRPITYGSFVAVGIMAKAPNPIAAYAAATQMASSTSIDTLSKDFSLPPVRRDLLQVAQSSPYVSVFFQSALSAFSWPDPNPASTTSIFNAMINSINSNATDIPTAVSTAAQNLQASIQ